MKNKYTEHDINQFFKKFKELPASYPLEKVHQLVTNPDAMARHKVKPKFKPLKFIIMTSALITGLVSLIIWQTSENLDINHLHEISASGQLFHKSMNLKSREKSQLKDFQADKKNRPVSSVSPISKASNTGFDENNDTSGMSTLDFQITESKIESLSNSVILSEKNDSNKVTDNQPDSNFQGIHFIELKKDEYLKLGFDIQSDKIQIKAKGFVGWNIFLSKKSWGCESPGLFKWKEPKIKLVFLSDIKGLQRIKWSVPGDDKDKFDNEYFISKIPYLVPIVMRQEAFPDALTEDHIFWFEPTESLFNALPDRIGEPLRDEYNFIRIEIPEEQQDLKTSCTYFEECKSTLMLENCRLFPNPANANATLEFSVPSSDVGTITLQSITGSQLKNLVPSAKFNEGYNSFHLDLSDVSEGIYMVLIKSSKSYKTLRLIISR